MVMAVLSMSRRIHVCKNKIEKTTMTIWTQAQRTEKMNPSVIREILKVTERPGNHQLCRWVAVAQNLSD